ncbi:DUF2460 domain-containing protein [Methylobacterium aquaticum]|uniref:DUF2460 domain-containing protein n=1 Tax=Methylobacterium aquaticum TaxID=270351 RepID=UPI003D174E19
MPATFPTLPGAAWPVTKRPITATRVEAHPSGREVRSPLYPAALYEFTLPIEGLTPDGSFPGLGSASLQALLGLYVQCRGTWGAFLFTDPTDSAVTGQALGAGDGVTTAFPFARTLGGLTETVGWVTAVSRVTVAGVAQASGWSLTAPNTLAFSTPPATGAVVAADFTYAFLCRFMDDGVDFEHLMQGLWQVKSLRFRSTTP